MLRMDPPGNVVDNAGFGPDASTPTVSADVKLTRPGKNGGLLETA
nr:hypothetical protein [Paenibacillus dendritiformis]